MEEDYFIPLLFSIIIFWFAWYKTTNNFWLSGGVTVVSFLISKIIYKLWNL